MPTTTLPAGYTKSRPIGYMTSNARATLNVLEVAWIASEWSRFTGGEEDAPYNVILERTTPRGIRVWVCDRDGPESRPILMLPEDY